MLSANQYWAKIGFGEHNLILGGDNYIEISSTNDISFKAMQERQEEALATKFDLPPNCDFLNHTIDQVYEFYKCHLRPKDHSTDRPHFSAFTFAVVDEACLRSQPQQLIICSDAPHFGEADDAIVLKQMRIKASVAWGASVRLEELTMTPKEAEMRANDPKKDFTVLTMKPAPPKLVPADESPSDDESEDEEGVLYVFATPAQARAKKRAGIKAAEAQGWVLGKGWADGKKGQSVDYFM